MRILPPLLALPFAACVCGEPLIVDDVFEPVAARAAPGSLHTYASNAALRLEVRSASPFLAIEDVDVAADGAISLDPEEETVVEGDVLRVHLRTGAAGDGTLTFTQNGGALTERTLTVVDADAIALAVTAADEPGLELPAVDPANVRIFAGGKAAFRATLTKDDAEIFGLDAVARTVSDDAVRTRNGVACAAAGCDRPRTAVEITVPEAVAENFDVTLEAGDASLVVTVVPTTADDVTELVADPRDTTDLEEGDLTGVVAQVLAGAEPVFGAPVAWAVEDAPVLNDDGEVTTGDALQLAFSELDTVTVDATLGERSFGVVVDSNGEEASVTSITAACGASDVTHATPLAGLALVLVLGRARRRR